MKLRNRFLIGLAAGLSVAAISVSSVILALQPFSKQEVTTRIDSVTAINPIQETILEANNLAIVESQLVDIQPGYLLNVAPSPDEIVADPRLANLESPFTILKNKIAARLGFGPEIAMLNGIHLIGNLPSSFDSTLGFYTPSTFQIFINMKYTYLSLTKTGFLDTQEIKSADGKTTTRYSLRNYSANLRNLYEQYRIYYDVLTEGIFQTIYHEYGHHITNVYLSSDKTTDDDIKTNGGDITLVPLTTYLKSIEDGSPELTNGKVEPKSWDRSFYQTFLSTLGYDSSFARTLSEQEIAENGFIDTAQYNRNTRTYSERTNFGRLASGNVPISNIYSLKELYEKANLLQYDTQDEVLNLENGLYKELLRGVTYTMVNPQSTSSNYSPNVDAKTLLYRYSLDELITRKLMQATMPFHITNAAYGYQADGSIRTTLGSNLSTFLEDTRYYANSVNALDQPFYNDYLFGARNRNGQISIDNGHAKAIYNALISRMGYQSGDDIAHLWWKYENFDGAKISTDGSISSVIPNPTDQIKFGGYLSASDLGANWTTKQYYLSYLNNQSQRVDVPLKVFKFNYFVKETLTATTGVPNAEITDEYFYVLQDFVSVSRVNNITNKKLYLTSKEASGSVDWANRKLLKTTNRKASSDVGAWVMGNQTRPNYTTRQNVTLETRNDAVEGDYAVITLNEKRLNN